MVSIPSLEVVRSSIRSLWTDTMTVEVMGSVEDPDTKITSSEPPRVVIHDAPCRISFETVSGATVDRWVRQEQVVKLFCDETLDIPLGSRITVTRQGMSTVYHRSGKPAIYPTHQEILLELEERHG